MIHSHKLMFTSNINKEGVINCLEVRDAYLDLFKKQVEEMTVKPRLLIIRANQDPSSERYVRNKTKWCEHCGIEVVLKTFDKSISQTELMVFVNASLSQFSAIILQEPTYKHIDSHKVNALIPQYMDCDGLTQANIGALFSGHPVIAPATPNGVMMMFDYYNYNLTGKKVLVIGRSMLVGRPMAELLTQRDATVTIAHSKTRDLSKMLLSAEYDVIISAIGKAKAITGVADMLVDVGINFDESGKLCGDFNLDDSDYCIHTSVPNGVGALTCASIVGNIIKCHNIKREGV